MDDFLPALHSFHPRPDIARLDCVQAVTNFVALAFTSQMVQVEDKGSVSKFSTVLLGDLGASLGNEDG